jgi:hypothetical protein
MQKASQCPACGGQPAKSWPALVAPFIADFVLREPVTPCRLEECASCSLRYFDERFTDAEAERLYADYRGERYLKVRRHHEPWYTERYNARIGHGDARVEARRQALMAVLRRAGAAGPYESVLDYGGDSGQVIPPGLAKHAFVFDLSGVEPSPGVTALSRPEQLRAGGYDLVLLSHVLEHLSDPLALLRQVGELVKPSEGLLYVEVPLERPWMGLAGRGHVASAYLGALRRTGPLLRLVDFYSTALRVKGGFVPPLGFPKLHEHINFFSPAAMRIVLQRAGFDVVHEGTTSTAGPDAKHDSLAYLARRAKAG